MLINFWQWKYSQYFRQAWDFTLDSCLSQLPAIAERQAEFQYSSFFAEQLTAFQVWLDYGSINRNPPEQLPIVLQVKECASTLNIACIDSYFLGLLCPMPTLPKIYFMQCYSLQKMLLIQSIVTFRSKKYIHVRQKY